MLAGLIPKTMILDMAIMVQAVVQVVFTNQAAITEALTAVVDTDHTEDMVVVMVRMVVTEVMDHMEDMEVTAVETIITEMTDREDLLVMVTSLTLTAMEFHQVAAWADQNLAGRFVTK